MKKKVLYGIIILFLGLIYTFCNFSPPDIKPITSNTDGFDRHNYLALMKKLDNHKIDKNGITDGWYIYGIFDTSNTYFPDSPIRDILVGGFNYSMDTYILIPTKRIMEK
jgi:hypothetical protein